MRPGEAPGDHRRGGPRTTPKNPTSGSSALERVHESEPEPEPELRIPHARAPFTLAKT